MVVPAGHAGRSISFHPRHRSLLLARHRREIERINPGQRLPVEVWKTGGNASVV